MDRERVVDAVVAVVDGLSVVIAALIGFAAGAVFTAAHRVFPPWGLILGLVVVLALVVGYRLAFGVRRHALAAALGLFAGVALFALQGPGGTILVRDDALGWSWMIAAPFLAAVAVVVPWPLRRGPAEQPGDASSPSGVSAGRRSRGKAQSGPPRIEE